MAAAFKRAGEGNACVRICFFVGAFRVIHCDVLEISRLLNKFAFGAMLADKLEILLVILLDVVVHCVLFIALLVAVGTEKCTGLVADIDGGGGTSGNHCGIVGRKETNEVKRVDQA
jgi:hypothetical protein